MKQMRDKVFIDSNILIYAYSVDEPEKQKIVKDLLNKHDVMVISTQTINEFINVTTRKKMLAPEKISLVVDEFFEIFSVKLIDKEVIQKAIMLVNKHRYSYFDSLMLASAIIHDCSILYSEDMHHFHVLEGGLRIINPFLIK
jgi:predicted nucleic acid-binding protein